MPEIPPDRVLELTTQLVAIPSDETEEAAQEHLAALLYACGFECRLQEVEPKRPNLIAQRGEGGTFVCSHIDTHPPHGHHDPLTVRHRGDVVLGRGVLDAKGQIAALVAALEAAPDAPALVAVTADEERGGKGSELLDLPDGPWRTNGGIVLEPTEMRVCTAQGGHIDLLCECSATPGHAFAPQPGGSPISAVLSAADALETCSFLAARHPLLPRPQLRIGRIEGGEHLWRSPARARAEMGLSLMPGVDVREAEAEVRSRLDDVARRWGVRGNSFVYDVWDASEPIELPADLPIFTRIGDAIGGSIEPAGMPSWTDAANLLLKHGTPCVVFGAGELALAHSDQESVRVDDLVKLAEVLQRVLVSGG